MLDIGLKEYVETCLAHKDICFNPCYVGYRSESLRGLLLGDLYIQVSILVMLDIGLKV